MKKIVLLLLSVLLASCAINQVPLSAEQQRLYETPLICTNEQQCSLFWERATYWVSTVSAFKIQTLSPSLIETFTPTGPSAQLAWKITKEPLPDGTYRIWIYAGCASRFGCTPRYELGIANAKRYIGTGLK